MILPRGSRGCWKSLVLDSKIVSAKNSSLYSKKGMSDHCFMRWFLFSFCVLTLFLLPGCYSGSRPSRIGSVAPDFTVQDSDHRVTLSQFRGNVVVLNFWATWCPPCVEELPSMIYMQGRMREKGVTVLAVSIDIDADYYHRFLKEHNVNLLTVRDPEQRSSCSVRHLWLARDVHHRPQGCGLSQVGGAGELECTRDYGVPKQTIDVNSR